MYGQLDLEVISNLSKIEKRPSKFSWCEEICCEKVAKKKKKKTLMFEHYNHMDPMEWGAVTFWGWCSTR
jgi:hypothetical protein